MPECPHCETPYESGDRYCGQCGTRLITPKFMNSGAQTQKSLSLADVHYNLGLVYFKKGRYQEALETWDKALEKDPANTLLQKRIAEAKARLQEG